MNNLLIILFTLAVLPAISKAQGHWFSLDDCINYVLENSKKTQITYLKQFKTAILPDLQLNADQQYYSESS
jgi:hypothetical protein